MPGLKARPRVPGDALPLVSLANPSLRYSHAKCLSGAFAIYHVDDDRGEHGCLTDDRHGRLLKALFMPDERPTGVRGDVGVAVEDVSAVSSPLQLGMHESPQLRQICVGEGRRSLFSGRDDVLLIWVHRSSLGTPQGASPGVRSGIPLAERRRLAGRVHEEDV